MKRNLLSLLLCLSLLLTGCGISGKRYVSVTPHREQRKPVQSEVASAANYLGLIHVLEEFIEDGTENGAINISDYPAEHVESGMELAVHYAMNTYPLGAYAVEDIVYEVGTTGGLPAMALTIRYRHSGAEIRQIRNLAQMQEAEPLVSYALENYDSTLVLEVEKYQELDFQQLVRSYAEEHPETVMETPQVTVGIYGTGEKRVVELRFSYQNGRDALRQMQRQVQPVFEAAELYVSGDGADLQKYAQLYGFLMERFDYTQETSITPAYSLLRHGVGDSRAFATVYAAMCRRAGLECLIVTGTREGEPWTWNIVTNNGICQHVDLLQSSSQDDFHTRADRDMEGYVWDYSAYPECPVIHYPEPEAQAPEQAASPSSTQPEETPEETRPLDAESVPPAQTEAAEMLPEMTEEKI